MIDWNARRAPRPKRPEDARSEAQVDFSRVIHSASFRRLQGKTQIFSLGEGDFYRTRLTHSLEVAQIASGIVQRFRTDAGATAAMKELLAEHDMVQAIGLTHDLGHPPFGHGGEVALNFCMRDEGGFEGNGQTLRILGRLEKYSATFGANLTRRTMLGVLKYPVPFSRAQNPALLPRMLGGSSVTRLIDRDLSKPPKAYMDCETDVVDWILDGLSPADRSRFCEMSPVEGKHGRSLHKSFDCSIMDLADDIAFGVHDLEDATKLGLMDGEAFARHVPTASIGGLAARLRSAGDTRSDGAIHDDLTDALFGRDDVRRKGCVGMLVNHLITECVVETSPAFAEPLLQYRASMTAQAKTLLSALTTAVREEVIFSAGVQQLEFKGQAMVVAVFDALSSDPGKLLPEAARSRHRDATSSSGRARVICDYIAGMTDAFLLRNYERLFSPRNGSIFDQM